MLNGPDYFLFADPTYTGAAKKQEQLSEEDILLDNSCIECVQKYITSNSAMKSQHELALQGFREDYQQLMELSRGLKVAHGKVWT